MNIATVASKFPAEIPGWLGTLVLGFDGVILFSAGDLTDDLDSAPKFVELARHLGVYIASEGAPLNHDNSFKRFTIMCSKHAYVLTIVGDAVYVVKRQLNPSGSNEELKGTRSSHMTVNV